MGLAADFWRQVSQGIEWAVESASRLSIRTDRGPIDSVERVFHFVSTRSALITQKKLYGYLKERMGISYPEMFEDEGIARSINIAKMQVFAASLSDLTIFAVAHASAQQAFSVEDHCRMAMACYQAGLRDNEAETVPGDVAEWQQQFAKRAEQTVWENVAAGANPFTESPKALIRWAPIADELKKYDREIVENSIRFAWNEVTPDFRGRVDAAAVVRDWRERQSGALRDG